TADLAPLPAEIDAGILSTSSGTYFVAKMPADTTGTLLGYIVAGSLIDDKFARTLQESIKGEVVIIGDKVLGSSLPRPALAWQTQAEWERSVGKDADSRVVLAGGEK